MRVLSSSEDEMQLHRLFANLLTSHHQPALELLLENQPDFRSDVADYMEELVSQTEKIMVFKRRRYSIDLFSESWNSPLVSTSDKGITTGSKKVHLAFSIINSKYTLKVRFRISIGNNELRRMLLDALLDASQKRNVKFNQIKKELNTKYNSIHSVTLLDFRKRGDNPILTEKIKTQLKKDWDDFVNDVFTVLDDIIAECIASDQWQSKEKELGGTPRQ